LELRKVLNTMTLREALIAADAGDLEILCDKCHEPIVNERGKFPGVILVGNIYAANKDFAHNFGGIVGNNFPHWSDADQPSVEVKDLGKEFKFSWLDIRPNAFHVSCLCKILKEAFNSEPDGKCPHCGGDMVPVIGEKEDGYHCEKCGYDKRMED